MKWRQNNKWLENRQGNENGDSLKFFEEKHESIKMSL